MAAVLTAAGARPPGQGTRLCSPTNPPSIFPQALGPPSAVTCNDLPQRTTGECSGGEGFEITFAGSSFVRAPWPRWEGAQKVWGLTISRAAGL